MNQLNTKYSLALTKSPRLCENKLICLWVLEDHPHGI